MTIILHDNMKCGLCHSKTIPFLDLGQQPLANKYPKKEDFAKEDLFPLNVLFCPTCKNVQLGTIISRERMFEDYYYLSSVNQGLVRHFKKLAQKQKGAHFVVDLGSNDGIFLKPLKQMGIKAIGVEPSINVSKIANDNGLETINSFFDAATVKKIIQTYGKSDVVVTSSVFTHLEDPHTFTEDVKALMTDDGTFIVEVEYIGHILDTVQFERFYLDRIFYYSLSSLDKFFKSHGMHISDCEKIEMHGTSVRVFAKKGAGKASARAEKILKEEVRTLTVAKMQTFKKKVADQTAAFKKKLEVYKKSGLLVAGYGAPARVATITNYGKIGPSLIEFIVDDSPLKQDRYSPGMHIPIAPKTFLDAKEPKPDVLVVFAFEYFDDIKKKLGKAARYRYLFPIPPREVR